MSATKTAPDGGGNTFARFWKCALQVNPVGYSQANRGRDHGLDPEAYLEGLLENCRKEGIALVGLADHCSVDDVDAIREYLTPRGIVVLPGFEIATTEKVHWVCLFPENTTKEQLSRILGHLGALDPEDGVRPSSLGGAELLRKVADQSGLCYAAHVTNASGVLREKFQQLWTNPLLRVAQIPGTVADLPQEFRAIARNTDPAYRRERPIAFINAGDVARPEDLTNSGSSCHVKMTRPGFDALCLAFKDPESRVRLAGELEEDHASRIERVRIEGGYLAGLDVRFSPDLNTVIGGRGTGKSTLLECIRFALGLEHKAPEARKQGDAVIRHNLGKAQGRVILNVRSKPQHLRHFTVIRRYGEPPRVLDADDNVSSLTPADLLPGLEFYGQNEIYELARDDDARIRVLDRFIPEMERYRDSLTALQRKLKANGDRLAAADENREALGVQLQALPRLQEQVKQFDALGLREKVALVPLLEKERQLPARLNEEIERVAVGLDALRDSAPDAAFLGEKAIERLPHADILRQGRGALAQLKAEIQRTLDELARAQERAAAEINRVVTALNAAREASESALEAEFAKLPAIAGKPGAQVGRDYQALLRQVESIRPLEAQHDTAAKLVQALEQERRNLLNEWSDVRNARTRALETEVKRLNTNLKGKLRLSVAPGRNRRALRDFLIALPGFGERAIEWVDEAEDLTVPALVEACRAGTEALLARGWGLTRGKAEALCRLSLQELLALETIDLEERVVLELNVAYEGETYRPMDHLSIGQQATAILHLLLLDNPDPLIMDQPEDNLDNAFIAERIVRELRRAKTSRQFLFATHNANIPVFGDAEWIGVFTATEAHGGITSDDQGSVDIPQIRDAAARILDGGREAFLQRQQKYGY